jgi:CheY-like chemotaxis protein
LAVIRSFAAIFPNPTPDRAAGTCTAKQALVKTDSDMSKTTYNCYRVLIVDGRAERRELLARLLTGPARSVEVRDNLQAALEFVRHHPIDVAIVGQGGNDMKHQEIVSQILRFSPHARVLNCAELVGNDLSEAARPARNRQPHPSASNLGEVLALADSRSAQ